MKLSIAVPLVFTIVTLVFSATASPSIVKDTDIQIRSTKEKSGHSTDSQTSVQHTHFEKSPTGNGAKSNTIGDTAHGLVSSFGQYGGDCSLNWNDSTSIGGGFNNGITGLDKKSVMGLGGGFNYNASSIDVGAGISAFDQKANYHLSITKEGKVIITFDSNKPLKCTPADAQNPTSFTCTT